MADSLDRSLVVPQRATIITSTTAEFYSRLYRIARGLVERGHAVTVIGRWAPGLARAETHPLGYRILRIDAGPLDGVPLLGALLGRRLERAASSRRARGAASAGARVPRPLPAPLRAVYDALAPFGRALTVRGLTAAATAVAPPADLYHAISYTRIPIALSLRRRDHARVVYDAADIYLDSGRNASLHRLGRWFLLRGERAAARAADRVITVSDAYAKVIGPRFGVRDPLIVWNCSYRFVPPQPPERRFHGLLGLSEDEQVVLYQGNFFPHRGIEQLVRAIAEVPRGVAVLMGSGPHETALRAAISASGAAGSVRIIPPVPPEELLAWVASADVVAVPVQPSTLNHRLNTPQKFFEAMAAGVPVVASDLPGMAPIVRETGCGVLVDTTDVHAFAAAIRSILEAPEEKRAEFRERALRAARERYGWEIQLATLLDEYTRLTGRRW